MHDREKKKYARMVAARLLSEHHGDVVDPVTWREVGITLACRLVKYHLPEGRKGEYAPGGDGTGVIQYNVAYTLPTQARVLVHELAHHLLMPLIPGSLFGEHVRAFYDDDPDDVRQQICRMAEEIVFRKK